MPKFKFEKKLTEGLIKSRPNRFIMLAEIHGKQRKCHCPVTGRIGSIVFKNIPCLLSKAKRNSGGKKRKTNYTVEAISLDSPAKKTKRWIGINQSRANDYVEFFLKEGALGKMLPHVSSIRREAKLGKSRIDFLVNGKDFLEVKTPLTMLPFPSSPKWGSTPPTDFSRLINHFSELAKAIPRGSRSLVALCFMYHAKRFVPPKPDRSSGKIQRAVANATRKGVENWQINLEIDNGGVCLLEYFPLKLFHKKLRPEK